MYIFLNCQRFFIDAAKFRFLLRSSMQNWSTTKMENSIFFLLKKSKVYDKCTIIIARDLIGCTDAAAVMDNQIKSTHEVVTKFGLQVGKLIGRNQIFIYTADTCVTVAMRKLGASHQSQEDVCMYHMTSIVLPQGNTYFKGPCQNRDRFLLKTFFDRNVWTFMKYHD